MRKDSRDKIAKSVLEKEDYNCDYRPNSYWIGPKTALINIMGAVRRREVEKASSDGEFESIPS